MTTYVDLTPAQMLAALNTPYYGLVFLGMAAAAYTCEGNLNEIPSGFYEAITNQQYTPQLPAPGQDGVATPTTLVTGSWSLDWGPANALPDASSDNSNLVYIASYRSGQGVPYFFVVGIRGTDTSATLPGIYDQLIQDIGDFRLVSWPDVLNGKVSKIRPVPIIDPPAVTKQQGNIAHGTALGFAKLANFTAGLNGNNPPPTPGALTVLTALNALLDEFPATPVVVTGHSLGGCQTQVMATYLGCQLKAVNTQVFAHAFAPPTAGDAGFVTSYLSSCANTYFWYNAFDLIPFAYINIRQGNQMLNLEWAKENLWKIGTWPSGAVDKHGKPVAGTPGPGLPMVLATAIDLWGKDVPTVYARPASGVFELTGSLPMPQTDIEKLLESMHLADLLSPTGSDAVLLWQHFPPCYDGLMWAQYASQLVGFAYQAYAPAKSAPQPEAALR